MNEGPRVVRDVVCAFSESELPMSTAQIHRRFDHAVRKAGFRARVRLLPIEDLPETVDVLVVPPELAARAETAARGARVIVTTRHGAADAAAALVAEIERGETLSAERTRPGEPVVVTYRGPYIL